MERHRLRTIGLALAISLGGLGGATAQTECDQVLKTELRTSTVKSSTRDQASRNFACSHDFQEFNDTYGGSASFTYGAIGGSGAYNQGNYKKFQQDRCSDATASDHQSGFEYYTLVDAGAGARTDWASCVANLGGFHCWAEPESQDIAIVLSQKDLNPYKIRDVTLSESATLRSSRTLIMPEQPVPHGHMRIVIHRNDQRKPVGLTIDIGTTISGILTTNGCSVTIPAVVVVVPSKPEPKAAQCSGKKGDYNFYGDHCGDGFSNAGDVEVIAFGHGGQTVVPKRNPSYRAGLGEWFAGDFNGDGLTDLAHIVKNVPGVDSSSTFIFLKARVNLLFQLRPSTSVNMQILNTITMPISATGIPNMTLQQAVIL